MDADAEEQLMRRPSQYRNIELEIRRSSGFALLAVRRLKLPIMTQSSPTLKLDPAVKSSTTVLLPLSIALHLDSSLPEPIKVEWQEKLDQGVSLYPAGSNDTQAVVGVEAVSKYLMKAYAPLGLAGKDSNQSQQIEAKVSKGLELPKLPFAAAQTEADKYDDLLALRTFLVGQQLSAADLALWAGIKGAPPLMGLLKKGTHVHFARWYAHLEAICQSTAQALSEAKSAKAKGTTPGGGAAKKDSNAASATAGQAKSFEVFLPSTAQKGQVVTRFPPEPSGYLHLGHTKAAILNQYFAKHYDGKLIVRFDDTNPSKEKAEFQDAIIEDLALLGIHPDQQTFTSDYFDTIYQYVIQLVKQGDAYADDTPQEEMRAQRMDGLPSARREMSVEDTLTHFAEMSSASEEGRKWCLRAKMSVDDPNKALRDPVIYRCNPDVVHHRTGSKYKVYPTYDFACPVVDSLEGVTHALRTNEYRDRNPQYAWMLQKLGLRNVEIWDFGRLNFQYTLLSKRKLTWFVDNGKVSGWDDPRFPTVRGIRRRGMSIEALWQFILATGPSQQIINMEWDQIWTLNKRIIDPVVPRFTAVEEQNKVKCVINGAPETHEKSVPKHKKNLEIGNKTTVYDPVVYIEQEDAKSFADNEEITLMDMGNVYVRSKETDSQGVVTSITMDAHFDGDFKKTKKKVHWLSSSTSKPLVEVDLLDFDYLITKPKLEEEDSFEEFVTPQTEFHTKAVSDHNILTLKEGDQIQFERKGYYILDNAAKKQFIKIPDGKLESSKSKAASAKGSADAANVEEKKRKAKEEREAKKLKSNEKKEKKEKKKGGKEQEFKELGDFNKDNIQMYDVKRVAEDIPTPVKTSMYKVKPII
ncbi:unnamed protein product [Sympodiomycopsis kandeliae]